MRTPAIYAIVTPRRFMPHACPEPAARRRVRGCAAGCARFSTLAGRLRHLFATSTFIAMKMPRWPFRVPGEMLRLDDMLRAFDFEMDADGASRFGRRDARHIDEMALFNLLRALIHSNAPIGDRFRQPNIIRGR